MPKTYTVKECYELDDGDTIGEVTGRIVSMFKPLTNQHGTLQNGQIQGTDGFKGKITFVDVPQNEKTAKGQVVTIRSVKNEKHGWVGCKMKDGGSHGRAIWVTTAAQITYNGSEQAREPDTQPSAPPDDQRQARQQPPQQPAPQVKPARWHVENLADLFATCVALVNNKVMPIALVDENATADAKLEIAQAYATSLFIQCDRNGITHAWNKDQITLPPVPSPEHWRETVIPKGEFKGKTLADLPKHKIKELFDFYDGKQSNTPFAECVYRAAEELHLLVQPADLPDNPADDGPDLPFDADADGDTIPFDASLLPILFLLFYFGEKMYQVWN